MMKVLILEACRSPEVRKALTESIVLSQIFQENEIEYEFYSNDGIWENRVELDRDFIRHKLQDSSIDIVHFAVHGSDRGLILKWSNDIDIRQRVPVSVISSFDIRSIEEFRDKLVVSGACDSAQFADCFLAVGARGFVAPTIDIPWANLGLFFKTFYLTYRTSKSAHDSLSKAIQEFPLYSCYRLFQNE